MDCIFVEGIEIEGPHGHYDEERERGSRFRVDLRLYLDVSEAGRSDDLSKTADYSRAAAIVKEVFEGPSVHLVETLATQIAERLLEQLPLVQEALVSVAKLNPPMSPDAVEAGVEVSRTR